MARRRGVGRKLEVWQIRNANGVRVPVELRMLKDDERIVFRAFCVSEQKEVGKPCEDANALKVLVQKEIKTWAGIAWKRWLHVECEAPEPNDPALTGTRQDTSEIEVRLGLKVTSIQLADIGGVTHCRTEEDAEHGYAPHEWAPEPGLEEAEHWNLRATTMHGLVADTKRNRAALGEIVQAMATLGSRLQSFMAPEQIEHTLTLAASRLLALPADDGGKKGKAPKR